MENRALITGAAGGLGNAMALACAARGFDVFLTDLDEERLAALAAGIRRQHPVQVDFHACDLSNPLAINGLWAVIAERNLRFNMLM